MLARSEEIVGVIRWWQPLTIHRAVGSREDAP
jgi:hypothetical protein